MYWHIDSYFEVLNLCDATYGSVDTKFSTDVYREIVCTDVGTAVRHVHIPVPVQ